MTVSAAPSMSPAYSSVPITLDGLGWLSVPAIAPVIDWRASGSAVPP